MVSSQKIEKNLIKNSELTKEVQLSPPLPSLENFLLELDEKYQKNVSTIDLFNAETDINWPQEQKKFFCKILYHARGRLHEMLWHLGNIAPNLESKKIILYNYAEEFGGHAPSHEQLYFYFAEDMGILSSEEVTDPKYYLSFFKKYNAEHINWIKKYHWIGGFAAFSAYERLDNIDYTNLYNLAKKLDITHKGMIFFRVHAEVEHFSATTKLLNDAWEKNEELVRKSFAFIYNHQEKMWKKVSQAVFNYCA